MLPALPGSVFRYPTSVFVYDTSGGLIYAQLSEADEWCIPVSLDKMGRWTRAAVVAIEDRRFYRHGGVDFRAVIRAASQNLRAGQVKSGASTITAQLVRMSDPRPRTIGAKLVEFLGACQLETRLGKDEILERYLNRAPFGGNIRGVEAASRIYFGKPASGLSLGESVLLAGLLRAPSRMRPDRYPLRAKKLRDQLLVKLEKERVITGGYCEKARMEPVAAARHAMPRQSRHAAVRAALENFPGTRVDSCIVPQIQALLERVLRNALSALPDEITASAVVVQNETRQVVGYVGNARFGSGLPGSDVDCASAPRSPGSTLKPFVYAASFARGLRTPASLAADTPVAFSGNAPRNYDLTYRGPVTTRLALAMSLNAPAVRVLRETGYRNVLDLYRRIGFSHIDRESGHYTDSLVLGGCEVSLLQLASAYAVLAGGGQYRTLRFSGAASPEATTIFSPEVAFMITDILREEKRLLPLYQQIYEAPGRTVAFKTGTSYGARDAWAAAYAGAYTVCVWFGDPAGASHPQLVGLELAAPAALRIFAELPNAKQEDFAPPEGIYRRAVCALSGAPLSDACPNSAEDYAIRGVSQQKLCGMHVLAGGRALILWPEELRKWSQIRGREGADARQDSSVRITRPRAESEVPLMAGARTLRLFVSAESDGEQFWYLNGRFVAKNAGPDGLFLDVGSGRHRLSVLSGEKSDAIEFEVVAEGNSKAPAHNFPIILNK